MAVTDLHTLETFRARFPHAPDDDAILQPVLDDAAERTPPAVWLGLTRQAHGYLAAHMLGLEPYGRDARLKKDEAATSYGAIRDRLERDIALTVMPRTA